MQNLQEIGSTMQFTFVDCEGVVSIRNFKSETWVHALDEFVAFLKGCGYFLEDNSIGVNKDRHPLIDYHECYRITTFNSDME